MQCDGFRNIGTVVVECINGVGQMKAKKKKKGHPERLPVESLSERRLPSPFSGLPVLHLNVVVRLGVEVVPVSMAIGLLMARNHG
jgi:hypothetical protein